MIVVINDTLGAYGGTHTLTLRICQWLVKNGYQSVVFCEHDGNEEIKCSLESNNTKIFCFDTENIKKAAEIIQSLGKDQLKVINYMWDKYLDMERLKYERKLSFDNILYCVHYGTFMKGVTYPGVIKRIVRRQFLGVFRKMNRNHALVMMDEDTTEKTSDWFGEDCSPHNPFVRIPMLCDELAEKESVINRGYQGNIVMSAARAELPYKGYQIGLIREFVKIKKAKADARLVMVSGREAVDIKTIKAEIEKLPEDIRNSVEYHDWMNYDRLKKYMEECKVFVGMGTAVLEAALKYKPSIPVLYNTYEALASNLLSELPESVAAAKDCKGLAINLILKVFSWDETKYREEAYKSFEAVKNCYDIDKNLKLLLAVKPKSRKSVLTIAEIVFIYALRLIGRIKHAKEKVFDISQIRKEC